MMQRQIEPLIGIAQPHQLRPEQRAVFNVKRQASIFARDPHGLGLAAFRREIAQINLLQILTSNGRLHVLLGFAVDHRESSAPGFMAADDFVERAFHGDGIERPVMPHCERFVVKRGIRSQLRMQPELLLRKRQWNPSIGVRDA